MASTLLFDRVSETSKSTGTGTVRVSGARTAYRSFGSVLAPGQFCTILIVAVDGNGVPTGQWECCLSAYSSHKLTRGAFLSSSTGSRVSFASGSKQVSLIASAQQLNDASHFNVKLYGALGDGSTNDTVAINAAIIACNAAGGGTVFVPAGTYMIDVEDQSGTSAGSIYMLSNVRLVMDPGTTLKAIVSAASSYDMVNFIGVDNAHVIGGTLLGDRDGTGGRSGEWGMGVNLEAATNCSLRDLLIKDFWGDGVYVSDNDDTSTPTRYLRMTRVRVTNCRRNGLSGIHWRGGSMVDCRFDNINGTAPEAGIDFEPNSNSQAVEDIEIVNLHLHENNERGLVIACGAGPVRRITFTNLNSYLNQRQGIWLYGATDCMFVAPIVRQNNQINGGYANVELANAAARNRFVYLLTLAGASGTTPTHGWKVASGCDDNVFETPGYGEDAFATANSLDAGTGTLVK